MPPPRITSVVRMAMAFAVLETRISEIHVKSLNKRDFWLHSFGLLFLQADARVPLVLGPSLVNGELGKEEGDGI